MSLGDFKRVLVKQERGATRRSEHAPHLGERFRVERVEPVLSRILPVEGRAAYDLWTTPSSRRRVDGVEDDATIRTKAP